MQLLGCNPRSCLWVSSRVGGHECAAVIKTNAVYHMPESHAVRLEPADPDG